MEVFDLDAMQGGWFVGDFAPSVLRTTAFEVALHRHRKGDPCEPHFHERAPEINLIVRGRMTVNGRELRGGQIFVFGPREVCRVAFLEDTELVVVKTPSVPGDKHPAPPAGER